MGGAGKHVVYKTHTGMVPAVSALAFSNREMSRDTMQSFSSDSAEKWLRNWVELGARVGGGVGEGCEQTLSCTESPTREWVSGVPTKGAGRGPQRPAQPT